MNYPITEVSEEDAHKIMDKVADFIAQRRMASPALMFIESVRPLNFIASQLLFFLAPFAELIFNPTEYQQFAALLEDNKNIEYLLDKIDQKDIEYRRKWKREKRERKQREKRKKKLKKKINKKENQDE
ncbi:MAG: hypothetical protein KGY75_03090 [Candidatus Cloacimonetes bacterium]|nr:hypothetical protein [Candidatus Cloacimonadota bacterium]